MSTITILFGTESGNAEMVADDLSANLSAAGLDNDTADMSDYDVADLADAEMVVLITSTYGEGELPETTAPFYAALEQSRPDLSALRFAAFGLGDSTYETYNNAIEILRALMLELGATQLGDTGKHDAASGEDPSEVADAWFDTVLTRV